MGAAGRLGVLPGCQAGHCGCAGEGRQSVGALPYPGAGAGRQAAPAPGPAQGAQLAQGAGAQGSAGSVILLLFLLLQGAKVYLNAVIQFHAPIDEAVLMWASYAVFKTSNVDKFEIN